MKFTGLILICASSVLALLLPAIGVVKFPMANSAAMLNKQSDPGTPSVSGSPSGLPVSVPGLPVSVPGLPESARGLPPTMAPQGGVTPDLSSQEPSLIGSSWTTQKLGLGVWVFLAPVMLLGLGLWTFAPNRRGLGR
jgi:hypothetical protein